MSDDNKTTGDHEAPAVESQTTEQAEAAKKAEEAKAAEHKAQSLKNPILENGVFCYLTTALLIVNNITFYRSHVRLQYEKKLIHYS